MRSEFRAHLGRICVALLAVVTSASGQTAQPGKNAVIIRGQRQDVYFLPARNTKGTSAFAVVFAPGDGGWRGFAIEIGETIASWGYDVFGFDTKRYLESFTSGRTTLNEKQIMGDMGTLGKWARESSAGKLIFVGWSEGAGLGVLALAAPENKEIYHGLAVTGLPDHAEMGWRWADNITYITKKDPNEPMFSTAPYLPQVAPLPLFIVQSTGDEYTPLEQLKKLFAAARDPKMLKLVEAGDHHFTGKRDEFFSALRGGIEWIGSHSQQSSPSKTQ